MASPDDETDQEYAARLRADPQSGLLQRIADVLAPYFGLGPDQLSVATLMALRIVRSFLPDTDGDSLSAARITALSLTALDLLRDANQPGLEPELRLKYIRTAVSVERAACQAEVRLEQRRKLRQGVIDTGIRTPADPAATVPNPPPPPAQPTPAGIDPATEVAIDAMVEQAMADYRAHVATIKTVAGHTAAADPSAQTPEPAADPAGQTPMPPTDPARADQALAVPAPAVPAAYPAAAAPAVSPPPHIVRPPAPRPLVNPMQPPPLPRPAAWPPLAGAHPQPAAALGAHRQPLRESLLISAAKPSG